MKYSTSWIAVAVAAFAVSHAVASEDCSALTSGAPCTDANGAASRCRGDKCPTASPCKGASELQECNGGYCVMQSPGNLNCVPADSVADQFKFDACVGKAEGADCTTYTFSRNDHKSAALYEGKGKCGAEGYCMSASATSCDGKKDGDKCSFEEASGLQMYSRSGTCKQPLLRIYKTQCNESSSKVIGPAKPIKAFDNRPGAPIRNSRGNASAVDFCDLQADGEKCTNYDGVESFCSKDNCLPTPAKCDAGAKELQLCGEATSTFCYGDELRCLQQDDIRSHLRYEACNDKKDDDECDSIEVEVDYDGRATVYDNGKGKCRNHRCLPSGILACEDKNSIFSSTCSFDSVKDGEILRFSGYCKSSIGKMDTCDGTAKTPRDFVKKATVIKQGPASDKLKRPSPAPGSTSSPRSDSTSSSNSSSGGGIPTKWYIIGTILVIKFFLFMAWLMRKEDPKEDEDEDEKAKAAFEPLATAKVHESRATYAVRKYLTPFQVPTTSITDIRHLGTSAFGSCWLVEHESGRQLASKRVAPGVADDTKKLSPFIASVMASAPLRHPQLIEFFGAVWTTANDLQALFEYAPNGDLCAWLHHPNTPRSWSATKFRIARDVLEAMAFAHAANPALVECDITSRKVMLVDGLRAKVRDITGSFYLAATAPSRWTAPEVVTGAARTPQAHMYTFGVLLSELDTHQLPFTDVLGEDTGRMAEEVLARRVAQDLLAPTFTAECPEAIVALARRCLSFTPSERPTVAEAIAVLDDALRMEAGSVM